MNTDNNIGLECLEKNNIILYYPYFANTYLLHHSVKYGKLLGDKANTNIIQWDEKELFETLRKEKDNLQSDIVIFFASQRLLNSSTTLLEIDKEINKIEFSYYQPRLMFIPFSLEAYRRFYSKKGFENHSMFIDSIGQGQGLGSIPSFFQMKDYLQKFRLSTTIYSDTLKEAEYLNGRINELKYFSNNQNNPFLKLLYYSAPYSIYLLNQFPEFLPIRIDFINLEESEEFKNRFETSSFIYCKSRNCCIKNSECIIKKRILNFHKNMFDQARKSPKLLNDVFYKYVHENSEQIPFHIFKNVDCFSKSITLHHKYKNERIDNEIDLFALKFEALTINDGTDENKVYNDALLLFEDYALGLYVLLIYHYILTKKQDISLVFKEIASSLIDRAFLNGKYYYIFQNIIVMLYLKFCNDIKSDDNPIKTFQKEYSLSERSLFSLYQSDIVKKVLKKILEIESNKSFSSLVGILNQDISKYNYNHLEMNFIKGDEIENTIEEINLIKADIFYKYNSSSLFNVKEKKEITLIVKRITSEEKENKRRTKGKGMPFLKPKTDLISGLTSINHD